MADITLFELHLDDAQFSATAERSGRSPLSRLVGSSDGGSSSGGAGDRSISTETDSGSSPLPTIVGLVVLAGIALAARRLLSRRETEEGLDRTEPIEVE